MTTPHFSHDARGRAILDLRREGAALQPELPELPALTEEERQTAIRTWRGRMVNEHISAQVWAGLLPQLMAAAAPPALLAGVAAAASDELRHARLCAGVVLALGGVPVAPLPAIVPLPEHTGLGPLEVALWNMVSVGCMSETVAVAVIRAEQAELEGTTLGRILAGILADEVQHARLGWQFLGLALPRLDDQARDRLSAWLVDALAHQVRHEIPRLPVVGGRRPELAEAGVCDGGFARTLFLDTIESVILPQLQAAGLAADAAWRQARAETAHLLAS